MPLLDTRSDRSRLSVSDRAGTPDGFLYQLVCNWPRILIGDVELQEPPVGSAARPTVRARVDLGSLLPDDVSVTLVPAHAGAQELAAGRPMWSKEFYHNGSYLFETMLPATTPSDAEFTIRVTPAADLPAWSFILRAIEAMVYPLERVRVHSAGEGRKEH